MPSSTMPIEMPKHLLVHCNKVFSYIFIYTYTNSSTKYISEVGGHGHEKNGHRFPCARHGHGHGKFENRDTDMDIDT